jgi:hypothetical protein
MGGEGRLVEENIKAPNTESEEKRPTDGGSSSSSSSCWTNSIRRGRMKKMERRKNGKKVEGATVVGEVA